MQVSIASRVLQPGPAHHRLHKKMRKIERRIVGQVLAGLRDHDLDLVAALDLQDEPAFGLTQTQSTPGGTARCRWSRWRW